MNNFVGFNELKEATGYKSASKIAQWLDNYNIPYMLGKHDRPVVLKEALVGKGVHNEPDFTQVA